MVGAANKYLSDMEPWKLRNTDPDRMATVLHVALQVVDDAKTLLTPFLPSSSSQGARAARRNRCLGGDARTGRGRRGDRGRARRPTRVLTGDYDTAARWESMPIEVGRPIAPPTPVFTKLDPSIVDEELARLEARA